MSPDYATGQRARLMGAFVGLAVGDALGAPVEFRDRGTFRRVEGMRPGGKFDLPAGGWTDDTAQALCLADSLLAHSTLDEGDLLDRFCRWAEMGENSATGIAIGIGQNTLRALGNYRRTGVTRAGVWPRSDGNGSLMRLAPAVIANANNPKLQIEIAKRQSLTTHGSPVCTEACAFLASVLGQLCSGVEWGELDLTDSEELLDRERYGPGWRHQSEAEVKSTGYVLDTLNAAMWAVENTDTFEQALLKAVNLGHDADTVGAVTGQIAGARYGLGSIPEDWLSALVDRDLIWEKARSLATRGLAAIPETACS